MGRAAEMVDRFWVALESGEIERLRAVAGEIMADDVEFRDPATGTYKGRAATLAAMENYMVAFSNFRREVVAVVECGDSIVVEHHIIGDHTAAIPMPGGGELPATGKTIVWESVDVICTSGDKLCSWHTYFDQLAFLQQLGLAPQPAGA